MKHIIERYLNRIIDARIAAYNAATRPVEAAQPSNGAEPPIDTGVFHSDGIECKPGICPRHYPTRPPSVWQCVNCTAQNTDRSPLRCWRCERPRLGVIEGGKQ